jgi:hypothetical protein
VFNPAAVGLVRGYPATLAAYEAVKVHLAAYKEQARADGKLTRRNVGNGWAGRKPEIEALRRNAQTASERLTAEMGTEIAEHSTDAELGKLAVTFLLSVVLDTSLAMRHRVSAARLALPCLIPKPAVGTVFREWTGGGVAFLESLAGSLDTPKPG